jgi:DNA-binding response OmpR family regulator
MAMLDAPCPGRWLLLIDDDSSVRSLVSEMLTILGYRVDEASDGVEGLGLFDRGHYDLVVTDYMMPRLNGAAVADAIRRKGSTACVMVLTGCADDSGIEGLRHRGIPILAKPVGLTQLKAAVEAAFR